MFCRNCGLKYPVEESVICVRCQAPKGEGNQYCPCCGNPMPPTQICLNCGVDVTQYGMPVSEKSKAAAGILGIFLGYFGVHNFYLGYTKKAIIQLVSFIVCIVLYICGFFAAVAMGDRGAVLVVLAFVAFFAAMGIQIWGFVEGILILCGKIKKDGKGRLLKN